MEAAVPAAPSVRYLNPAWFAAVMGTGVLALALAQFGLVKLALPVYGLALVFMAVLLGLYLVKLLRYPQATLADLQHPLLSQMLPTLPIALLVLSLATRVLPLGPWALPLGQGLFLLGTPLIFLVGLLVVYWVSTRLRLPIEAASGAWFIPPVSALLVPMAGGLWLSSFPKVWQKELWVVSGLFLGIGLFLFLFVLPSFLQRLYGYGRLEPHFLPSVFIGLAPVGLLVLAPWRWLEGGVQAGLIPEGLVAAWPVIGLAVWGLGLWWLAYSLLLLLDTAGGVPPDAVSLCSRLVGVCLPPGGFYPGHAGAGSSPGLGLPGRAGLGAARAVGGVLALGDGPLLPGLGQPGGLAAAQGLVGDWGAIGTKLW